MFGSENKKRQPTMETFFGPDGVTTVFHSGAGMANVMKPNGQTDTYFRCGNMVTGPEGTYNVIGSGPTESVFGPDGSCHTIFHTDTGGTIF